MAPTQHPLETISKIITPDPPKEPALAGYTDSQSEDQLGADDKGDHAAPVSKAASDQMLNLSGIRFPALLINSRMRLVWQNKLAVDQIWHSSRFDRHDNLTSGIFELLCNSQFRHIVDNWRQWADFFVRHLIDIMKEDEQSTLLDETVQKQKELFLSLISRHRQKPSTRNSSPGLLAQELTNGSTCSFDVSAVDFAEGRLFIFKPLVKDTSPFFSTRSFESRQRLENIRRNPNPVRMSYGVLAAMLDNSNNIKISMLADDYCRLVHDLFQRCLHIVETFAGIFCKHSDSGFLVYFIPFDVYEKECPIRAVECALALKNQLIAMNRERKLRKAWMNEILLNMAIHSEHDYLGALTSSIGDSLTTYGSAVSLATELSQLSRQGQIWATKDLINELPSGLIDRLRFGIHRSDHHRQQTFFQRRFLPVRELLDTSMNASHTSSRLGSVPVTQVFDVEAAG